MNGLKRFAPALGLALLLVGFCAFAVFFGDEVWAAVTLPAPTVLPALPTPTPMQAATNAALYFPTQGPTPLALPAGQAAWVWVSESGSRYHAQDSCSGMQSPREVTLAQAVAEGYTACQRCKPPAPE